MFRTRFLIAGVILLLAVPAANAALGVRDMPVVRAVRIWPVPCVDARPRDRSCLEAYLAVTGPCATEVQPCHDGRVYPLKPGLVSQIFAEYDSLAPVALRLLYEELVQQGMFEAEHLDPEAKRCIRQIRGRLHYRVLPDVTLAPLVEARVSQLADVYHRMKRRPLVITSGTRTPVQQADAMYIKLRQGGRFRSLYRRREAAAEIRQAYRAGRRQRMIRQEIIASMAAVIRQQMLRGIYVSEHLREGAVDIRSRGMSRSMKRALRRAARRFRGLRLMRQERRPPHFHLQVDVDP